MSDITANEVELEKCTDNVSFEVESDRCSYERNSVMRPEKIKDFNGVTLFPEVCKNNWK